MSRVELSHREIKALIDRRSLVRELLNVRGRGADVQREVEEITFDARQKMWDALEGDE